MSRYFEMSPSVRTLQFNAFTFDVFMADMWVTLAHGGRICMPTDEERFGLNEFILVERCNFASITPSIAATIDPDIPREHFRRLATIGEAVKPEFMKRFAPAKDEGNDFVLCDTWGPTEASVMNTGTQPITLEADGQTLSQRAGDIGLPVGCAMFIVSANDPNKLAPAYAPGEIAILGLTLASGYWADEGKTREVFKTDLEWAKDPRWIKLYGENVMRWGDDSIVFMYRKGGYMKVNGLRIDPGEVEAAVAETGWSYDEDRKDKMLSWSTNVVSVLEHSVGEKEQQMRVCFVAESEAQGKPGAGCAKLKLSAEHTELVQRVAKGLEDLVPEYMVPGAFVLVDRIPYRTSLKMDRKALLGVLDGMDWNDIVKDYAVDIQA
ncbi:Nonribosomal peptide synthetase gloA [Fulvia fulva]|nr:Nonribosomal peptide synthetase gloA [Fulvia fulva]KAK4612501.1 Nonribosomal peptide synthetase gloA [Fulvia fulva]WPV21306.1 Nonribosomal peptide synthetase gloA [Fulvia fulva]